MRLALAQINPTVGDIDGNAALAARAIESARAAGADLVALPELCLCGYPPKDLLFQQGFVPACVAAARALGESGARGITAVLGLPLPADPDRPDSGRNHNALVAYRDGELLATYRKRLLPTYDVFDEDRYFIPGREPVTIEVAGARVGLAICEDLWRGEDAGFSTRYLSAADPVADLAAAGARVIVTPSASPFALGKGKRHRRILAHHARTHGVHVASVNQVGGNDELIFDGHAAVYAPTGELIAAAPGFDEHLLVTDLPPQDSALRTQDSLPDPLLTNPDEHLLFSALVLGIRDYCRKTGFRSALVGLSGGIDSALTAALAVAALGAPNVFGVAMPGRYSSEHSKADAYDLAERLNIPCPTIPIEPPFAGFRSVLDEAFVALDRPRLGASLPDLTEENLQARVRGTLLMALSNRTGAIVLTTGNKSELAVGYSTLYGDMNGGLAVLSDVAKTLVYRLSRWINANHATCGFATPPIPESTIAKAPSAELRPDQTDQDSLPPYDTLDEIIDRYVERRQAPAAIAAEAGIDAPTVARVVRMIDLAEYKRKQAALGLKVTTVAFGSGRRYPIAQRWRPWEIKE